MMNRPPEQNQQKVWERESVLVSYATCAVLFQMLMIAIGMVPTVQAAVPSPPPNIVLCMADDQGYGDVGYYGASPVQTPILDAMAAGGLRFDRYYAAAPVCSPTRASVLTGRHPNRLACFSWGHPLRPQETTIAEALKQAGYTTGHFGKWHLGSTRADSPVCPGNSGFDEWLSSPNFYENDSLMSHNGTVIQTTGESSMVPVEAALTFMEKAQQSKTPFLTVIWFGSPHAPHISSPELAKLYEDQPEAKRQFLGEVTGIDRAMGRLREGLRQLGVADQTLLWYTSDNGALPVGSTAGLSGQKGNLLEGGLRVPSIIEWPSVITEPRIIETVCGSVDIYPTVLNVVGVNIEGQTPVDGESLLPLIREQEFQRSRGLGFWVYPEGGRPVRSTALLEAQRDDGKAWHEVEPDPSVIGNYAPEDRSGPAAWIEGDFKLHRVPRGKSGDDFEFRLFNLRTDRVEKVNLADALPEQTATLKRSLEAWQASVVRSLNGQDYQSR